MRKPMSPLHAFAKKVEFSIQSLQTPRSIHQATVTVHKVQSFYSKALRYVAAVLVEIGPKPAKVMGIQVRNKFPGRYQGAIRRNPPYY